MASPPRRWSDVLAEQAVLTGRALSDAAEETMLRMSGARDPHLPGRPPLGIPAPADIPSFLLPEARPAADAARLLGRAVRRAFGTRPAGTAPTLDAARAARQMRRPAGEKPTPNPNRAQDAAHQYFPSPTEQAERALAARLQPIARPIRRVLNPTAPNRPSTERLARQANIHARLGAPEQYGPVYDYLYGFLVEGKRVPKPNLKKLKPNGPKPLPRPADPDAIPTHDTYETFRRTEALQQLIDDPANPTHHRRAAAELERDLATGAVPRAARPPRPDPRDWAPYTRLDQTGRPINYVNRRTGEVSPHPDQLPAHLRQYPIPVLPQMYGRTDWSPPREE